MKTFLSTAFILLTVFLNAAIPPPYQPNPFSTNVAGNPVLGQDNISITNVGSTTNWQFFNAGPRTVARLGDVTNVVTAVAGNVTNALSIVSSNGIVIALGVTNMDFIDGTNISWKITNVPSGDVHVSPHLNPAVTINASNYTDARIGAFSNAANGQFIANSSGLGTNTTLYGLSMGTNVDWVSGNVIYVPTNASIQTYVNLANTGDTLILGSGHYPITATITIAKALNILGQGNAGFVSDLTAPSHGTVISSATAGVVAFQINTNNVRLRNLSISLTGNASTAINTSTNLYGISFSQIDVIVICNGLAQGFTVQGSDAVLRDLTFYIQSLNTAASGVWVWNDGSCLSNNVVEVYNVTGTTIGAGTYAYGFVAENINVSKFITLNLYNSVCMIPSGTPLDVGVASISDTTSNSIVNAFLCTVDGADYDAYQTGTNVLALGGSVVVNNRLFGTPTYRATMVSGIVQTPAINGGILANEDITIEGTAHATKTTSYVLMQTNGGSVGIGTNVPIRTFHVRNDAATPVRVERSSSSSIAGHVEMYNSDTTDGNAVSYDFLSDTTGAGASSGVAFGTVRNLLTTHDHATRAGDMLLMTLSPAGNLEKVRIKSAGQVGIGTNNPQARLHVVGDGSFTNLIQAGTTLSDLQFAVDTNGGVFASNGYRLSTNANFADNEWVTEEHLQAVIETLEGATYFLQTNAHPVVSGTLATRLTKQTADQFLTNSLSSGSNQVAIWLSTNFVASGVIPAGAYDFHMHARKTSTGPDVTIGFDVVRTNGSGISTIVSGETNVVPSTTETDFLLTVHVDTPVIVSTTDYIGVRYYAIRGGGAVSIISHVGGTTDSHFTTPNLINGGTGTGTSVSVSSNGTVLATATNLNFVNAPLMTNASGNVSIDLALQPGTLASFTGGQSFFDDFLYTTGSGTISAMPPFGWQAGVSGGASSLYGGETNAPGIWRILSGTSSGNVGHINCISTSSGGFGAFALGQIAITNTWRVRFDPVPTPAEGGRYSWGFGDSTPNVIFADGVWFQVDTNRINWVCLCASNSVVVGVTNTTIFPTNNTWYTLTLTIDTAGSAATFYVNGTAIATNTGRLPLNATLGVNRTIGLVSGARKDDGSSNMTNDIDYCFLTYKLNAVR